MKCKYLEAGRKFVVSISVTSAQISDAAAAIFSQVSQMFCSGFSPPVFTMTIKLTFYFYYFYDFLAEMKIEIQNSHSRAQCSCCFILLHNGSTYNARVLLAL